jgi:hypothetical protein
MPQAAKSDSRRHRRFKVRVPATLRVSGHTLQGQAHVQDISVGGMFLYADSEFEPGSELQIVLMMPREIGISKGQMICCHAKVLRLDRRVEDGKYGIAATIERFAAMPQV